MIWKASFEGLTGKSLAPCQSVKICAALGRCTDTHCIELDRLQIHAVILPALGGDPNQSRTILGGFRRAERAEWYDIGTLRDIDRDKRLKVH